MKFFLKIEIMMHILPTSRALLSIWVSHYGYKGDLMKPKRYSEKPLRTVNRLSVSMIWSPSCKYLRTSEIGVWQILLGFDNVKLAKGDLESAFLLHLRSFHQY